MVAKSYQKMEQVGEPYVKENGRIYVKVKNTTTGTIKEVRWYDETEYARMYPGETVSDKLNVNQKNILGFQEGYITIFKGNIEANEYWFERSIARYCKWWGWYIVSTETVPFDLPADIEPVELKWETIGQESGCLRPDDQIVAAIDSILYANHPSTFQGNVGDRLELDITVINSKQQEKFFGSKSSKNTIHTFEDTCGNHYMWQTGAKFWAEGSRKRIRGSVKEHKIINNIQTTVLTRCMEVMK